MESYFSSEFFTGNRRRLRKLFTGTAPIIITANGLLQRGADSAFVFAQDANFWYLTGIDIPDIVLVMDRDKEYLIVPARDANREAFDGAVDTVYLSRRSGVDTVLVGDEGWSQLGGRLKKVKHAATIAAPPAYAEQFGLYTNPARTALIARIKGYKSDMQLLDLSPHLVRMRMIKQPEEVAAIQAAVDITAGSLRDAFRSSRRKKYGAENELEAEISYGFRRRGAAGHAFEPIVAGGRRACTLHNIANDDPLSADELVVVDVGAEVEHYAADITRTISLAQPSRRQRAVHAAVLDTQQYAMQLLKPGVFLKEYQQETEHFLGEKLRELGLIKSIAHDSIREYCPHAISHFLGLNVHDVGDYDKPLEPGMVLTVEPGIYIRDESLGVRIEDDIIITDEGHRVLSRKIPTVLD